MMADTHAHDIKDLMEELEKLKDAEDKLAQGLKNKPVYWELKDEKHNKFWAITIVKLQDTMGNTELKLIRKWGRIGTKGQKSEKTFSTLGEAEKERDQLIRDKESKGYKPVF